MWESKQGSQQCLGTVEANAEKSDVVDNNTDHEADVETKLLDHSNVVQMLDTNKESKNNSDEKSEHNRNMKANVKKLLQDMPLTKDISCGFWIFKGKFLQRFANHNAWVVLYGLSGSIFAMSYSYFNGTITTIEKRFKIPSRNTGIITVGYEVSLMIASAILSYYAGRGHRPRWIGFGVLTIVLFCLLNAAPHFMYGPGEEILALTTEYGETFGANSSVDAIDEQNRKNLCKLNGGGAECEVGEATFVPQVMLFMAQLASGIGGSLVHTLGVSYMDDNTKKSKTPIMLSISYFLRLLGPAAGYSLASYCLSIFVAPKLHPTINDKDPRWLGAWWMGWLVNASILLVFSLLLTMFPKELPRTAAKRIVLEERRKQLLSAEEKEKLEDVKEPKASIRDLLHTFRKLTKNRTYMCNNLSSVFYFIGYVPYWIFAPKYIEIQFRQSAATSNLMTGTVAIGFSAVGILLSGFIITRYKPSARYMAGWNVITGLLTVAGMFSYTFIGCPDNEKSLIVNIFDSSLNSSATCNSACGCDYVPYAPVCGENALTYISPCHAGCKEISIGEDNKKTYYDCSCIPSFNRTINSNITFDTLAALNLQKPISTNDMFTTTTTTTTTTLMPHSETFFGGQATSGACPVDCFRPFLTFLLVKCTITFLGAAGRASNFLVSVRCVPEKDKTVSLGFGMVIMCIFALIPSPIFFGWLLDRMCLVWGKTCTNKGNCWLYDTETLRYILNITASSFVFLGALFDGGVWYYVKDLNIFNEEVPEHELEAKQKEQDAESVKKLQVF